MSGTSGLSTRRESGQMAVELAVLMPVIIVVGLIVFNLMRFVELCAAFDRIALDAIVSQGVSPEGEQSEQAAAQAIKACVEEALASTACTVEVSASSTVDGGSGRGLSFPVSPLLTTYVCTLSYRPWPSSFVIAGVPYQSPLVLKHERALTVDRFRPGAIV